MASVCNLAPSPKSFATTVTTTPGRHRLLSSVLSLPICTSMRDAHRRLLTISLDREAKSFTNLQFKRREVSCNAEVASGEGIRPGAAEGPGLKVEEGEETVPEFDLSRLEAYTERYRTEVLSVNALVEDEEDEVIVFKGFSSSVTRATPEDPSKPALPPTALIQSIHRMRAPYSSSKPQYIERGLGWQEFDQMLKERGL